MSAFRAVAFDFNGTLSHDEPILYAVYRDLFAEHGRPLTEGDYYGTLAGLTEETIIGMWLGVDGEELGMLVEERIERYLARNTHGETISPETRAAVAYAASRVPVAVVSGAFRREIEPVLAAAGLGRWIDLLVAADDVERGKPDPEGYLRAISSLDGDLHAQEVVALEDTHAGVAAAKAAGVHCIALLGTHPAERLRDADELVEVIDVALIRRLVG
ncbi:MAG: HAD family phosphatase [Gaiellaceae bacterium]